MHVKRKHRERTRKVEFICPAKYNPADSWHSRHEHRGEGRLTRGAASSSTFAKPAYQTSGGQEKAQFEDERGGVRFESNFNFSIDVRSGGSLSSATGEFICSSSHGGSSQANEVRATSSASKIPPPSGNGMAWVNTDSGVYHKEGTRYYGKTKSGKYMSEADAMKAGYHAAKNDQ